MYSISWWYLLLNIVIQWNELNQMFWSSKFVSFYFKRADSTRRLLFFKRHSKRNHALKHFITHFVKWSHNWKLFHQQFCKVIKYLKVVKEDAEEKKEGDAALNELFQKIYADGNEDTRRAMVKSFQVSSICYVCV